MKEVETLVPGEEVIVSPTMAMQQPTGEAVNINESPGGSDSEYISFTFTGKLYGNTVQQTYNGLSSLDYDETIKAGGRTVAIRKAIPYVEQAWREYLRGEVTMHQFRLAVDNAHADAQDGYYSQEYQDDWRNPQRFA